MAFFITLLIYATLFVLSELLRPKPEIEDAKPAGLGDFQFPTATEGRVVPLLWGTTQIKGPNVIWYGDLRRVPMIEKIKTGLWSSEKVVIGFKYEVGIQFGLFRASGTGAKLKRVWIGEEEIFSGTVTHDTTFSFDDPNFFDGDDVGNGGIKGTMRFFEGNLTQLPSNYLNSLSIDSGSISAAGSGYSIDDVLTIVGGTGTAATFRVNTVGGAGEVTDIELIDVGSYTVNPPLTSSTTVSPAGGTGCTILLNFTSKFQETGTNKKSPGYRGTCYLIPDVDPIYVGNSASIQAWQFELERIPDGLGLGASATVNGADANPANVLYEILTNTEWGLGFSASKIDATSFSAAGTTLATEGNGFSYLLDRKVDAIGLIKLVEEQIDGVVFLNQLIGKYQLNLVRDDFDINLVPELTEANVVETLNFARGSWDDTTNEIRIKYTDRSDEYKTTFALAQDLANIRVQQGVTVSATKNYPGIRDGTLANSLAWRDLRTVSFPLAKATVLVDRTFYDTQPASVLAFTDSDLELTKLPMRVARVDMGDLADGKITLDLVQDIFSFQVGAFGDPPSSGWTPPTDSLLPFIAAYQLTFEAPRALVVRGTPTAVADRVWCGARRRGPETSFLVRERHAVGSPTGAFAEAGEVFSLFFLGELDSSLAAGTAFPVTSIVVVSDPDLQTAIETAFTDGATLEDIGTELINLILIDDEFMLVSSAQTVTTKVQLDNVYRSALDSVQASHSAGAKVFLLFAGGGLTDTIFTPSHNVDIKLLPRTASDTVLESEAVTIQIQPMDDRLVRPYPPSSIDLDGTFFATTTSLEGIGGGGEDFGIDLSAVNRRDFRTVDEIQALTSDAASIFIDFPAANSTEHEVDVRNDPDGLNTLLFTTTPFTGTSQAILRIAILKATSGVLPTRMRFVVRSRHTVGAVQYESRQLLTWDFNVTSALTGDFNFGSLDTNIVSNVYTSTVTGQYDFTLSSAFSTTGDVQYRLDGGSFLTLIAQGNTTGNIPTVTSGQTIEIRHTSTDSGAEKFITMAAAGAGQDGYAVLFV